MYNKATINHVADIVRDILGFKKPAYDPVLAVSKLSGKIQNDIDDMSIDASIQKCPETEDIKFIINFNEKKPSLRTRFSIAHELGHLFLHMGYLTKRWDTVENFTDSIYYRQLFRRGESYSQEESEANEFAAAFLMPLEEFKMKVYENINNGKIDFDSIANYFQVSIDAVITRAKIQGFIEW